MNFSTRKRKSNGIFGGFILGNLEAKYLEYSIFIIILSFIQLFFFIETKTVFYCLERFLWIYQLRIWNLKYLKMPSRANLKV